MIIAKMRSAHVPVEILRFHVQGKNVRQNHLQFRGNFFDTRAFKIRRRSKGRGCLILDWWLMSSHLCNPFRLWSYPAEQSTSRAMLARHSIIQYSAVTEIPRCLGQLPPASRATAKINSAAAKAPACDKTRSSKAKVAKLTTNNTADIMNSPLNDAGFCPTEREGWTASGRRQLLARPRNPSIAAKPKPCTGLRSSDVALRPVQQTPGLCPPAARRIKFVNRSLAHSRPPVRTA